MSNSIKKEQFYYEIISNCIWFAKGQLVKPSVVQSYFTSKAIKELLDNDYLVVRSGDVLETELITEKNIKD